MLPVHPALAEDPPVVLLLRSALRRNLAPPAYHAYAALLLSAGTDWTSCSDVAASADMSNHQLRQPLAHLVRAGLVERRRRRDGRPETTLTDYRASLEGENR